MTFISGTKLGTYEIVGPLGSGGMGEVYRARDSKLKREVAIKVLPDAFARDAERVARFQREAEVLASVNHPHIAAIYELAEFDHSRFLVLELVEGQTLAEQLKRGPIPVDEALAIARQIAEALEAAHEKGITHRDLKPANIKVTPEGQVKVLDFGLAKAMENAPNRELSNSPTLSMAATNAGVILGTAAYMSPEQAKGLSADSRSDVFSFGCVLYEMLTGRQTFQGETISEILASVLVRDPDFTRLPPDVNPRLVELLRRCLDKNPKRRWQAAGDLKMELETVASDAHRKPEIAESVPAQSRRRERLAWIAAVLLLLAVAATFSVPYFRAPAETPEMRTDIVTPSTSDPISFAISPDGRRLVFVASGAGQLPRLWLRPLDAVTAQPIAGTEGASYPFWSPDSRSVGFFADGKLKRLDIGGGLPQTLANATAGRGGTWSPEGVILFAPDTRGPLFRVPASGGEAVAVTKADATRQSHRFPQFLPEKRQFLFYVGVPADAQGIYMGSLDAPETRRLTAADSAGLYAPSGWLLFVRQGTLVARRFDPARGELSGDPVTVADPISFDTSTLSAAFSVSAAGLVSYRTGSAAGGRRQLTWFDRSGKQFGTVGAPDENNLVSVALSPDGRRAAATRTVQGNVDVWLLDTTRTTRFTFDASNDQYPIWSPDGGRIVFDSNRRGRRDFYQKQSGGAGSEELLLESTQDKAANSWSPDGRFLLYYNVDPKTGPDIWVLPLDGNRKPYPFLNSIFDERTSQFSPDGRWVAYQSTESGRFEIYVRPFPGPGGQWQVSTSGGSQVRWRPDGKELYYIAPDGKLMATPITVKGTTLEPGTPVSLFQTRIWGGGTNTNNRQQYDVAPDGRFLINVTTDDAVTAPITLLQNWKPVAK